MSAEKRTETNLQEETLTPLQQNFFAALRTTTLDTIRSLIAQETARPDFKLSDLLSTIDYWQITNPLHPDQPHFSADIQKLIWNLILSCCEKNTANEILRWAIVTHQSEEVIDPLIACISDINATNERGVTFLHLACFFNQRTTVESLLAKEANPFKKDIDGNLPLHFACANNHLRMVMRLLNVMMDRSCILDILNNGTVYSADVKEALELYYDVLSAKISKKKTPSLSAMFLDQNAHIREINLKWNTDVKAAFKRQKQGK